MNVNDIVSIISSVGFPIVMCGVCCFFVKWYIEEVQKTTTETIDALRESINKQTEKLIEIINKLDSKGD